ncbi:MAG: amino-acid N-acetyltransferase [Treponema sp.]|jgi:amino-acid N-acetyltransferase|nr:amino-acid N-acetyltransferase [Treponema sp.]
MKAEQIRSVLRYIDRFKNAVAVIHLDDRIIDAPLYTSFIRDIRLIHQAGMRVIIVPGARKRIDEILAASHISWEMRQGCRVTGEEAIPLIKMAAFDVSNRVMTALAGEKRTAVIGNWVRARRYGVIEGVDYGTAGDVDRIDAEAVRQILASGFIPIFPCIGWNAAGKPFNISSLRLAAEIAVQFKADKLFCVAPHAHISSDTFTIPEGIGLAEDGHIPALNFEEAQTLIAQNQGNRNGPAQESLALLAAALEACSQGVVRAHILNGETDGALPCEIFSDFGSGTMIYKNNYGGIRNMTPDDIPAVLNLMRPFVEQGILLPRTQAKIAADCADYIVFELDGGIRACAALHQYNDGQAEIAALAVNEAFAHIGTGPKLLDFLIDRARKAKATSVFALTTKTADWFEQSGFQEGAIETLPTKRREKLNPARGSKLFRLVL